MTLIERLGALYPSSSRRTLRQWLARSRVAVNDRIIRRGELPVGPEDRVTLREPSSPAPPGGLRVVYEDQAVLVIDKPAGLLTIATERERLRTAYRMLSDHVARTGGGRVFVVHRLDRETSGLVCFAKSPAAKAHLQAQFEARTVERVYVAVVEGRVRESAGILEGRLVEDRSLRVRVLGAGGAGKAAITRYRVLERRRASTLLELTLVTGRRGQLRAQLAALGHPIVGDVAYGSRRGAVNRLCLHATRLGFRHPDGSRAIRLESPPPAAFRGA